MVARRKRPKSRGPYWRKQRDGSKPRAWGDFRFLGGKREPLCAPGESFATTSEVEAASLYATRLAELSTGVPATDNAKRQGTMSYAVADYVRHRRAGSKATANWLRQSEIFLGRAVAYFGPDRRLRAISPDDVAGWVVHLRGQDSGRGSRFSEETIRKHVHALPGLFRRAQRAGWVPLGYDPVAMLEADELPTPAESPNVWLEVHDAAKLIEAARTYRPGKNEPGMHLAYPVIATFLLTGGRADEVLGLDLNDILFDRKLIAFRPNRWRRGKKGKTTGAERMVPLWPQLEGILRDYLQGPHLDLRLRRDPGLTLLFPSSETGGRIVDIRKMIDRVARRAGLPEGIYRATAFRKTYASARLQTLDHGAPVAPRTVQGELGHRSGDMIEQVYGRLGTVRHRSEVVEYRAEAVMPERVPIGATMADG